MRADVDEPAFRCHSVPLDAEVAEGWMPNRQNPSVKKRGSGRLTANVPVVFEANYNHVHAQSLERACPVLCASITHKQETKLSVLC